MEEVDRIIIKIEEVKAMELICDKGYYKVTIKTGFKDYEKGFNSYSEALCFLMDSDLGKTINV